MTFEDEILYSSESITFIIVDRFNKPGGHWLKSYDFVTLHQPAVSYDVKLRELDEEVMRAFLKSGNYQ